MASTGKTTNYELSQFIGTDKPSWLGDYNGDMLKIDTALGSINATATTAQSGVASAQSAASAAQMTANAAQQTATANAQDITKIKANLLNNALTLSIVGNHTGTCVLSYNDYLAVLKVVGGYNGLPNNTVSYSDYTRFPFASANNVNVFDIGVSTLADANKKIFIGSPSVRYVSSGKNTTGNIGVSAYYDGANTVFYFETITAVYTTITQINDTWGSLPTLFSGRFISVN